MASKLTRPHSWKSFRPGPAPSLGSSWGHLPALHLDPGLFVYLVYRKAVGEGRTLLAAKVQEDRERRKTEGGWSWGLWGAMCLVGAGAAWQPALLYTPPARVHSTHYEIGSSSTAGL